MATKQLMVFSVMSGPAQDRDGGRWTILQIPMHDLIDFDQCNK
ncbi:hypothetical protein MPC4_20043 [Methylocella tundrae]|uniref:Uncharacterized protein n=1 Tax=Methylocella tundrae TaxID=227605 RepID=A0A8B6M664_METTU|nr:hypothetical protein MPC4_20043 [Methylocella tundrae]